MSKNPGLYIHIPFCRSKCPYCDFYSIASLSPVPHFMNAIKKEIISYKDRFSLFDTIYIGGGTPTVLSEGQLEDLIKWIYKYMRIAPECEITIEANPCDINIDKARALRSMGINRISLGIQSFDDDILKFLGRRHRSKDAIRAFDLLRSAGFDSISIDLIYGIPGQKIEQWFNTLKKALFLFPEHISCYQLTFEKRTPFWRRLQKGEITPIDEETEKRFFIDTSDYLESNGYIHYEISNFAKGEKYFSQHNQKYWLHIPYLGLGPSAHSFDGKRRWWNYASIKKYCNALQNGILPIEDMEELSEEQIRMEKILLGLRTCHGIEKEIIGHISEDVLSMLERNKLLHVKDNRIIPTKKGFSVADQLTAYLI